MDDAALSNDDLRAAIVRSFENEHRALEMMQIAIMMLNYQVEVLQTIAASLDLEHDPTMYVAPSFKTLESKCVRRAWEVHCDYCGPVGIGVCQRIDTTRRAYSTAPRKHYGPPKDRPPGMPEGNCSGD